MDSAADQRLSRFAFFKAAGGGGGGGGGPTAPTLGAARLLTSSANAVTTSWLASGGSGYTPAVPDALVRVFAADNGTGVAPIGVTIGGAAVTLRVAADAGHGGTSKGASVGIGTVRGLATGSALDVVMTTSGTTGAGKILLLVTGLVGWGGAVGASNSALVNGASAGGVSTSVTPAAAGSLLVGVGGVVNINCAPLVAGGWNIDASPSIGTTAGNSTAAVMVSVTGGAAGAAKGLTVAPDPTAPTQAWTDFAIAVLELS